MKKLKLGSLFDGSGGFPAAAVLTEKIEPIWASEIEPFPILVTKKRFPEMTHYGDISELSGWDVEPVDIITFGSPCFPAGTMITTDKGDIPIEDVQTGMYVLTHNGRYRKVTATGWHDACETVILKSDTQTLECTPNHPILTGFFEKTTEAFITDFSRADQSVGMFWATPRIFKENSYVELTPHYEFTTKLHSWNRIKSIELCEKSVRVYNMTVEEDNTYVADGIVVHNCQDLSVSGKREGLCGERSSLFYEAVRVIKEMREVTKNEYPKYAVWENVPGAFSSNKRDDFLEVLRELAGAAGEENPDVITKPAKWEHAGEVVGDNYSIAWRVLDAQFWGVPQRRKRIFLVVDFGEGRAGEILFEPESVSWNITTSGEAWKRVAGSAKNSTASSSFIKQNSLFRLPGMTFSRLFPFQIKSDGLLLFENHRKDARYSGPLSVAPTVTAQYGTGGCNTPLILQNVIPIADKATRHNGGGSSRKGDGAGNGLGIGDVSSPSYTLTTQDRHGVAYSMGKASHFTRTDEEKVGTLASTGHAVSYKTASGKDVFGTLMANAGTKQWLGNQEAFSGDYHILESDYVIRRLTPLECCRLQGFPDNWTDGLSNSNPSEDEIAFWAEVWETHRKIVSNNKKPKTKSQIIKWLKNPYSDSAIYKMWGNGVALPCVYFVLSQIANKGGKDFA